MSLDKDLRDRLKSLPIFRSCDEQILDFAYAAARFADLGRGEYLCLQGDNSSPLIL
jgi:hypothetical protein